MPRLISVLKNRYRRWREQARYLAIRDKFRWLERQCNEAGEAELATMVALVWDVRRKGEHQQGMLALLFRNQIGFGPLNPIGQKEATGARGNH